MADITIRNQGRVTEEGKVNWRGDQVTATPGDQSIYDSSEIQLVELGARKVVGDRVFRYAKAAGAANAGKVVQSNPATIIATAGAVQPAGAKRFTFYFATTVGADVYAEGYVISQSGTAGNMGFKYRVKGHSAVATTSDGVLVLYDPLKLAANVTDNWSLHKNMYDGLTQNTAGTAAAPGVTPIVVADGDYFWLQTWGPANVKCGAAVVGQALRAGATGQVEVIISTSAGGNIVAPIGYALQTLTASEHGLVFLTIAP